MNNRIGNFYGLISLISVAGVVAYILIDWRRSLDDLGAGLFFLVVSSGVILGLLGLSLLIGFIKKFISSL